MLLGCAIPVGLPHHIPLEIAAPLLGCLQELCSWPHHFDPMVTKLLCIVSIYVFKCKPYKPYQAISPRPMNLLKCKNINSIPDPPGQPPASPEPQRMMKPQNRTTYNNNNNIILWTGAETTTTCSIQCIKATPLPTDFRTYECSGVVRVDARGPPDSGLQVWVGLHYKRHMACYED